MSCLSVIDRCADNTSGCDSERGNCTASVSKEDFTCECKPGYTLFTSDGVSGRSILSPEDGMTPGDVYYLNHTCVREFHLLLATFCVVYRSTWSKKEKSGISCNTLKLS